jgi:hypothetical protein
LVSRELASRGLASQLLVSQLLASQLLVSQLCASQLLVSQLLASRLVAWWRQTSRPLALQVPALQALLYPKLSVTLVTSGQVWLCRAYLPSWQGYSDYQCRPHPLSPSKMQGR